jgi:hypothetical protein
MLTLKDLPDGKVSCKDAILGVAFTALLFIVDYAVYIDKKEREIEPHIVNTQK